MIKHSADEIFNPDYSKWPFKYNVQKGHYTVKHAPPTGCCIKMFDCSAETMVSAVSGKQRL